MPPLCSRGSMRIPKSMGSHFCTSSVSSIAKFLVDKGHQRTKEKMYPLQPLTFYLGFLIKRGFTAWLPINIFVLLHLIYFQWLIISPHMLHPPLTLSFFFLWSLIFIYSFCFFAHKLNQSFLLLQLWFYSSHLSAELLRIESHLFHAFVTGSL